MGSHKGSEDSSLSLEKQCIFYQREEDFEARPNGCVLVNLVGGEKEGLRELC